MISYSVLYLMNISIIFDKMKVVILDGNKLKLTFTIFGYTNIMNANHDFNMEWIIMA